MFNKKYILLPLPLRKNKIHAVWILADGVVSVLCAKHVTAARPGKSVYRFQRLTRQKRMMKNLQSMELDLSGDFEEAEEDDLESKGGHVRSAWTCPEFKGSAIVLGLFYVSGDHFDQVSQSFEPPRGDLVFNTFAQMYATRAALVRAQFRLIEGAIWSYSPEPNAYPFDVGVKADVMIDYVKEKITLFLKKMAAEALMDQTKVGIRSFSSQADYALLEAELSGSVPWTDTLFSPFFNRAVQTRWGVTKVIDFFGGTKTPATSDRDMTLTEAGEICAESVPTVMTTEEFVRRYRALLEWAEASDRWQGEVKALMVNMGLLLNYQSPDSIKIQHPFLFGHVRLSLPKEKRLKENIVAAQNLTGCISAWDYNVTRGVKEKHELRIRFFL